MSKVSLEQANRDRPSCLAQPHGPPCCLWGLLQIDCAGTAFYKMPQRAASPCGWSKRGFATRCTVIQACWEDSIAGHHLLQGAHTDFLHSPLLDELKALESRVQAEFAVLTPSRLVVDR